MLVLLSSWLSIANLDSKTYEMVEGFAGIAQVARAFRMCNMRAAATDIEYDEPASRKGAMDLTTPSGFVLYG